MDQKVKNARILFKVLALFTLMFFVMSVMAVVMKIDSTTLTGENGIWANFLKILGTPAQCTQDMYGISVAGTYFNMGMCCLLMLAYIVLCGGLNAVNSGTVAAFFLTVGFSSWGMNVLNMLPLMLGMQVYALIKKKTPVSMMNLGIFATAIAPIMSEVMLRWPGYPLGKGGATIGLANINPTGIILALVIAILFCLFYPPMCAKAPNFHFGCDLFNAGPPAGFLCLMTIGFLMKVPNVGGLAYNTTAPLADGSNFDKVVVTVNNGKAFAGTEIFEFVLISYLIVFIICFILGNMLDKDALKNYGKLIKDSGHGSDFIEKYGIGATLINFGVYGAFILAFYTCMKFCFGAQFGGGVAGVVWCAFTWVAAGAHPRNVLPIGIGYVLISLCSTQLFPALGIGAGPAIPLFTPAQTSGARLGMHHVAILIAFSYATGMAPISGKYGFIWGVIAGMMHFAIVVLIPLQYDFFNFYNGGFTAGVVAFVLIPFIEHYFPAKADAK